MNSKDNLEKANGFLMDSDENIVSIINDRAIKEIKGDSPEGKLDFAILSNKRLYLYLNKGMFLLLGKEFVAIPLEKIIGISQKTTRSMRIVFFLLLNLFINMLILPYFYLIFTHY